ncbi:hypothetical protein FQR65_LT00953 [Abscondita terminalis]|nr:hypothetical protein FQR65_LT00953 [Abscondita terminalis]
MCSTLTSVMDIENLAIDDSDGIELPELLQNLLISVEHAIERVPLDELANPCPQCLQYVPFDRQEQTSDNICSCQCLCRLPEAMVLKKDTSIQTSPMFEYAGPIPHIDSDEDDDKDLMRTNVHGRIVKELEIPKRIADVPEKLFMSGINLPGTVDAEGRPIILCYAECIVRAGLNKYEIAKVLLYYGFIPSVNEKEKGFSLLLLAETDESGAVSLLDDAISLILHQVWIAKFLIWKPNAYLESRQLKASQLKGIFINDESMLEKFIKKDQSPASCGGSCTHDQLEWVEFIKQLEPFLNSCRSAGRALLSALSQLRNEEIPVQVNRRFLNHQCRQISKVLQNDLIQKLRRDGVAILQSLEDRTQWLSASRDVKRLANFASSSFNSVDRVAKRLEQLAAERKERLKELARLRTLEEEAVMLLTWIRKVGDETLRNQSILLRTAPDVASVKAIEKDFEKFYFDAMRQIDRVGDLVEESNNIPDSKGKNLKENAVELKTQMKVFSEKLEEARENIENCSRCLQLVESSTEDLEDGSKEWEDIKKVVNKTGNEKLMEIYKEIQMGKISQLCPDADSLDVSEVNASSTPIKPQPGSLRRRSVSSIAFIYKCNHHAAGVSCNCYESDTENSVSYKLKKKYMQSLQSCGCNSTNGAKEVLDRKNSLTLDGIKEVRESVENLLEKFDKSDSRLSGCGRCDSGVSTADNSVGDDSVYKKKLQNACSCQFYRESCSLCSAGSSSTGSNHDHTENQQDSIIEEGSDGFGKSGSDDIEDEHFSDSRRKVPPVSANSHLHCHSSTLHLPVETFDSHTDPKTQKTLLFIMREMIHTERDYVKSLDYIIENYIPELMRDDIPQALRGQRNVIFGNVEKIYEFHSQHFLRELEYCENNPLQVGQIFLKHSKKFYLYALYNKNKPKSDSLLSEYGTSFFKTKQLQLGDKMDLASYLLKPVQRMGKYALLLQQMMKACPVLPAGAPERAISEQDDLKQAEEMVRFQLRHGNDLLAMDSIRDCDVNLKEQGKLVRQNEFLVWEGRTGKKTLRQVFLFEELILFSKARRFPDRKNLDLFIYKNSIKLTDIGLTAKIGDSPTKFEIWFRKRKPNDTFTIQSTSEDIKKAWAEEISQLLWKQAIRNREARMAEMSSMGIGNKPCLDIRPSADQISDRSISFAQLSRTAPRFRNSIAGPAIESCRSTKRPHSVISMSSISSSSTSSGGSIGAATPTSGIMPTLGFESVCGSPKSYRRSGTLNSQCSTESGIIADISLGTEDCHENINTHWPLEKSNSQHSTSSSKSNTTTPTQSDDTQITMYHVPEDLTVNI